MDHTKEPWTVNKSRNGYEIRGSESEHTHGRLRNSIGISSASFSDLVATVNGSFASDDPLEPIAPAANAERIVSCVNAMAGIPDPAAAIAAAREALEWTLQQAEEWYGALTGSGMGGEYREQLQKAHKALALLNGQQP